MLPDLTHHVFSRRASNASFGSFDSSETLSLPACPPTPAAPFGYSDPASGSLVAGQKPVDLVAAQGSFSSLEFGREGSLHSDWPSLNGWFISHDYRSISAEDYHPFEICFEGSHDPHDLVDLAFTVPGYSKAGLPEQQSLAVQVSKAEFPHSLLGQWPAQQGAVEATPTPVDTLRLEDVFQAQSNVDTSDEWAALNCRDPRAPDKGLTMRPNMPTTFTPRNEQSLPLLGHRSCEPKTRPKTHRQCGAPRKLVPPQGQSSTSSKPTILCGRELWGSDKSGRPILCQKRFRRPEHLTRHQKCGSHRGPKSSTYCPLPGCKKSKESIAAGEGSGFVGDRADNVKEHIINTHCRGTPNTRSVRVTESQAIDLGWQEEWAKGQSREQEDRLKRMVMKHSERGDSPVWMQDVVNYFESHRLRLSASRLRKVLSCPQLEELILQKYGPPYEEPYRSARADRRAKALKA